jgi:glycine/D-amino acid oxidase-like deaminating enzyme
VIGSGAIGLATARLVQEAGFPVTIYTAALPPDTTSNVAGGQFHPFAVFRESDVTPEFMTQFSRALDYSWRRYQIMVGDDYGIRWLPTYVETDSPDAKLIATFPPINRMLTPVEHPFPWPSALRYDTMYVETGRYLRQMTRDVQVAGGRIEVRRFATPADIAALPESLAFNCTGLGSRDLFGDQELHPIRGQLAILEPQPEIRYAAQGQFGYMFPRADGILLGGTFERDVWDPTPDPAAIARIVASHKRFFSSFRCTA